MIKQFYFKQFSWVLVICLHSINFKQFYLTYRQDSIRCYPSRPEWTWEWWQWKGTLHSPKLLYYWSHTIRLFSVKSRKLVGGRSYPSVEMESVYSSALADWATFFRGISSMGNINSHDQDLNSGPHVYFLQW